MNVTGGSTDVTTYFVLRKAADGTELTGATITNIDLVYTRSGSDHVAKVDATALAAPDSAHADNKAIEVDSTSAPGLYRVDWPDAAFAAGVPEVILTVIYTTAFTEHLRVTIDAPVNVTKISGDSTAADNCELMFDGTGYAGGSTKLGVNVTAIEGADPTDTIRDSVVDDATRIDASALNTLSGKAPSKSYLAGSSNSDGDIQMDEATGNYGGTVATVTTLTNAPSDSSGVTTLLSRIVGTLLAGNHTAQSGDSYAIVNNGTHGNAALKTLIDVIDGIVDNILVDTGTTLDTLIKDIPTVAEFEARSLPAADYTVVSDLGVVQTGDSFAIVNGDHGLVSIQDDIDLILADTGTDGVKIDLNQTVSAFTGAPNTVGKLLYMIRQWVKNKLDFNKSTDQMILYEDDGTTPKFTHSMVDNASNATRGAGA